MYAEHLGFSKLPFSITPDPQVFFDNSVYREAFVKLQHGVLSKKGLVLITGEVGTGKTTLLRKLLNSLGPTVHSVLVVNPPVGFPALLRLILNDLDLACEHDDKRAMIQILNQSLIERSRQGHTVTVLIDEAHNLSDEALEGLRLLSNLKADTEKLLQIVLMAQPELEVRLDHPKQRALKQRITIHCRLVPLKKGEVCAYIQSRLNAVGFRGESPFERASLEAIALYSKGIPRLVNIICDRALLAAYAAHATEVSARVVEAVARDLQLSPPEIKPRHPLKHEISNNRIEPRTQGERLQLRNVFTGANKEHRPEFQRRRRLTGLAVGIFLAVLLGGIAISYSQQSTIYFSNLSTRWMDFSRSGRDYFSDSTVKVAEAVRARRKSLGRVEPIERTVNVTVSSEVNPSKRAQPSSGDPADTAEKPPLISRESQHPKQDNRDLLPIGGITPAETQRAENTGPLAARGAIPDSSKVDSHPPAVPKPQPSPVEPPGKEQSPYLGNFKVVDKSFVRDTPKSNAEIVTTLLPGTLVRVERKTGRYFDVRSLNGPRVHGYVHEEDAFFKRVDGVR